MKKLWSILLALCLLLSLAACADREETAEEADFLLWFTGRVQPWSVDTQALEGTPYRGERTVTAVTGALLAGPEETSDLTSPIPAGTRLQNWSLKNGVLRVDLSPPYNTLVGVNLTLADYCLTLTLTQLEGVDGVIITVNGGTLPFRDRQILRESDVVFSGAEEEPVRFFAALCFRRAESEELGVELRSFRLTESEQPALAVLEALAAGPSDAGLMPLLPPGVQVYSARVENGVCYADFSRELLEGAPAGEEDYLLMLRSITETLCSLESIQSVQILVEGAPVTK